MKVILRSVRHILRMLNIFIKETAQSIKYTGFIKQDFNFQKWRLLLLAHSLEKGLFLSEKKPDFGEKKAIDLLNLLKKWQNSNNCFEYDEAYCVLLKYKEYREKQNLSNNFLAEFDDLKKNEKDYGAGYKVIKKEDLKYNFDNFCELCNKRHSIREFDSSYPILSDIIDVIKIATKAPSACNRQMIKVFFSVNSDTNSRLAQYIPGNSGTRDEKVIYIFIAGDISSFDYFETEQWMLNGGIFASYLTLGFTAKKIGSCIYQWPIQWKYNERVKQILNIPKQYAILTVIGIGNYRDEIKVLDCSRKEVEEYYQVER